MAAKLILQDGTVIDGTAFGSRETIVGELVFHTGMTDYQDLMENPRAYGQIVLFTYPLIGNAGISADVKKSVMAGIIVRELCDVPSNFRSVRNLNSYALENKVAGLSGIDTRALTENLRDCGSMVCALTSDSECFPGGKKYAELLVKMKNYKIINSESNLSVGKKEFISTTNAAHTVAVVDFGCGREIAADLFTQSCSVTLYPRAATAEEILSGGADGIILSDGPGDARLDKEATVMAGLLSEKRPILGIGYGNCILALANKIEVIKLKSGHHGGNYPIKDFSTGRTHITSLYQNYAVANPGNVAEITDININDNTAQGISYKNIPALGTDFITERVIKKFISML